MWPELFGQFWGLVALTVMVVVLAYVVLILLKPRPGDRARTPTGEAVETGDGG